MTEKSQPEPCNLLSLKGKTAIVTGASSGLGAAIALLFAEYGAKVIAVARRKNRLDDLASQNPNIIPVEADVTQANDLKNVMQVASQPDILVNNAGVMDDMLPAGEVSDEMWNKVLDVNLKSVMNYTQAFLNACLDSHKPGSIINIASVGGLFGARGGAAYVASKHGVVGLTKNTAYVYAPDGIRCNAICPGAVATEINATGMKNPSERGFSRMKLGMGNIPRQGSPEEVANLALFLASDASSLLNGAIITADAGWSAY